MNVELMDKIMSKGSFTVEQRRLTMKFLRKAYYANNIDKCIYTSVRDHVCSNVIKEGK